MPIEGILDGLQQIATAFDAAAAQLSGAETLVGLELGGTEIADSSSNGVDLVTKKTELLRSRFHSRHKFMMRVVKFMLRNSMLNKFYIMLPGFALSLLFPAFVNRLWPVFVAFGTHLGMNATKDAEHLFHNLQKKPQDAEPQSHEWQDPAIALNEKAPDKVSIRHIIEAAARADAYTTVELTAAVLGGINNLPRFTQACTMVIYGVGMTAGVSGVTTALVKMEDWGHRLEKWEPRNPIVSFANTSMMNMNAGIKKINLDISSVNSSSFGKFSIVCPNIVTQGLHSLAMDITLGAAMLSDRILLDRPANVYLGEALQNANPKILHAMPWFGAVAKFVTSGRVINHASSHLEAMSVHAASIVGRLPYIGNDLTAFITTVTLWGATGIVAGGGAEALATVAAKPLKKIMWNNTARSLLLSFAMGNKNPPLPLNKPTHLPPKLPAFYCAFSPQNN
jgi:predicted DNA repair protein MutK